MSQLEPEQLMPIDLSMPKMLPTMHPMHNAHIVQQEPPVSEKKPGIRCRRNSQIPLYLHRDRNIKSQNPVFDTGGYLREDHKIKLCSLQFFCINILLKTERTMINI